MCLPLVFYLSVLDGLFAIGRTRGAHWILTLTLGALQLGIGVYLLRHPLVSFSALIILIAAALIVYAVFEVVATLSERDASTTARTLNIIATVISIIAGVFILMQPAASGVAFVWVLGLFALVYGPVSIALSLDVQRVHDELK